MKIHPSFVVFTAIKLLKLVSKVKYWASVAYIHLETYVHIQNLRRDFLIKKLELEFKHYEPTTFI